MAGAAPSTRIVSTSPSITEILFALGLGDRVVGVSTFCRFPPAVGSLPKIGTFLRSDAELIARLRPDLVVIHAGPSGIEQRLSALRIPFVTVERGRLSGAYSSIRRIATAAGVPDRAGTLIAGLENRLQRVRSGVAGRKPQRTLLIVGRRAGTLTDLIAVGRESYLTDLLTIAGGVNVLASDSLPEYPRISMETVIRLAPDVIIDAGDMGDALEERKARQITTETLWQRQPLAASRAGRVHAVTSDAFVVPGPRVVEAAETMALWLHGVAPR
jgi:iron complex transport system substrate-binding protein